MQIAIYGAVFTVLSFLLSLIYEFDITMLSGLVAGYAYVMICNVYLALTIEKAVTKTQGKAKKLMLSCYSIRFAGLILLCWLGAYSGVFNIFGLIIPQFFPRIALTISYYKRNK